MRGGDELLLVFDNSGDWGISPCNPGTGAKSGTHISFLDADDVYLPVAFDATRVFALENPDHIGIF
jgi:hypothetical protein